MKDKGLNSASLQGFKGVVRVQRLKRSPIRRKSRKRQPGDDPAYCVFVRRFFCVVCASGQLVQNYRDFTYIRDGDGYLAPILQNSPTECAHVGRRGLSQKCPDCESLPLCAIEHHRIGPESHHRLGKRFWGFHGLNRVKLITQLQALYEVESGKPARLRRKVRVP
jgi:hypothetical protein